MIMTAVHSFTGHLQADYLLTGRHVLVTGGGSGIGAQIAKVLAATGARVSLIGRDYAKLITVANSLGDNAGACLSVDITDEAAVNAAISSILHQVGAIDTLINNAGRVISAPFAKTDMAIWSDMLAVNLTGAYITARAILPGMVQKSFGRIVNIASTAGVTGYAYTSAYVAAKHGLIGLTRALAVEFGTKGITVNAVCPGFTDTPLLDGAVKNIVDKTGRQAIDARASLASSNPSGRLVVPQEVADTVRWLVSSGASAINGQAIVVAGGMV